MLVLWVMGFYVRLGVDETALDMEWLQRFGLLCPIGSNEANFIKEARKPLEMDNREGFVKCLMDGLVCRVPYQKACAAQ